MAGKNEVKVLIVGEDQFSKVFTDLHGSLEGIKKTAEAFLTGFGIERAIEGVAELTTKVLEAEDAMGKTAQKTGLTTAQFSGLAYAADVAHLPMETLAKNLERLDKALLGMEGSAKAKAASDAIKKLGIDTKDAQGNMRGVDEILLQIAERFKEMPDGVVKSGLAMQIFGKAGAEMIPFLNKGRDGISELTAEAKAFSVEVSGEAARNAEEFNETLKRLEATAQGAKREFVDGLEPGLSAVANALLEVKKNAGGADESLSKTLGKATGGSIEWLVKQYVSLGYAFQELKLKSDLADIFHQNSGELAQARIELINLREDYAKFIGVLEKPHPTLVQSLFGKDPEAFSKAVEALNKDFPLAQKPLPGADTGPTKQEIFDALATSIENVTKKSQELVGKGLDPISRELEDVRAQVEAIAQFKLQHPEEIFPLLNAQQEALMAREAELQRKLNTELKDWLQKSSAAKSAMDQIGKSSTAVPGKAPGSDAQAELEDLANNVEARNKAAQQMWEETRTSAEKYALEIQKLNILYEKGAIDEETYNREQKKIADQYDEQHKLLTEFGAELGDQVKQAALYGRSWHDVFKTLLVDLVELGLKWLWLSTIQKSTGAGASGGGGGFGGGILGAVLGGLFGKHASGGGVQAGMPLIVGENGPELFTSPTAGSVVPNYMLGGAGTAGELSVSLVLTSDVDLKIERAGARFRDQAVRTSVQTSLAMVRERQLRT
jgi:hypothetical protein